MVLLAECGVTCVWVGEQGVRYYAHGRGLSRSARLVEAQARLVSSERSRLAVARRMFERRFPGEDVARMDMQRLRGLEGARMRQAYVAQSRRTRVAWSGRAFDGRDADPVNQALSATATCLYGVAHSVITALGASPDLGFVHSGNDWSFVYDVTDLYRVEIALPVAFDVAAEEDRDVQGRQAPGHARPVRRDAPGAALCVGCAGAVTGSGPGAFADRGHRVPWRCGGWRWCRVMVVVVLSRVPPALAGLLTRWLVEVQDGVYVGNVSAPIRRSVWERVQTGVGRGSALMVWPSRNDQGLEFASHNHGWGLVDSDGLTLVRRPTTDEAQRRRALEVYSGLDAAGVYREMRAWLRRNRPKARVQRARTTPARVAAVRTRAIGHEGSDEGQSMREGVGEQ